MVEKHAINSMVKHKITLIDDTTKIIQSSRVKPYLRIIGSKDGRIGLKWGEKERLKELIE